MENERRIMKFFFITQAEVATHYHQDLEIIYLLTGEMTIKIDDAVYHMGKGDYILINANKRHSISAKNGVMGARFFIDFHMLAEIMGTMQLLFWCNTVADKNDAYQTIRLLMNQILGRYYKQDDKSALYLNALSYQLVYEVVSNFLVKADDARISMGDSQDAMRIKQIQNYIQGNFQSQIRLSDLAEKLYLSEAYLSKYIKKHVGMTFLDYVNNIRLFHAVDEIMYSAKNLTHIATDNGFPTSAAFTKAFREAYHMSPSEYRRQLQEEKGCYIQEENINSQLAVENQQRILKYLQFPEKKNQLQVENKRECRVCTENSLDFFSGYCKMINVGEADCLLQSEVQNQLREIKTKADIRYARVWNLITQDIFQNEGEELNFRKLNQELDFIVEHQMKPYLELGLKPSTFIAAPGKKLKEDNTTWKKYSQQMFFRVIREFCMNLINRYGVEEIETWYFEFWKDPRMEITQENGEYYSNFDYIYKTLKDISPKIQMGGSGFIMGYETQLCKEIFQCWSKRQIRPDFLTFCSYQYIAIMDQGERYGRKSIDPYYISNQLELLHQVMKETDFEIPAIHLDEWNFTVSNRNVLNDSCQQGAYILKNCIDLVGKVDVMAYWHGLDSYSEYYDTAEILNGDSGVISRDGIHKPSFYALEFWNRLLSRCIYKDENAIVTTNGRNHYVIACHSCKKLTSKYVFKDEDQIEIQEIPSLLENQEAIELQFQFLPVKPGDYLMKSYYINQENGSVQDLWKKLDYAKNLAKDELEYLKKSAIPAMEMKTIHVKTDMLELSTTLMTEEIRLIDIQYQYSL